MSENDQIESQIRVEDILSVVELILHIVFPTSENPASFIRQILPEFDLHFPPVPLASPALNKWIPNSPKQPSTALTTQQTLTVLLTGVFYHCIVNVFFLSLTFFIVIGGYGGCSFCFNY